MQQGRQGSIMTYEEFFNQQDVHAIKYHHCPYCDEAGRILVDIETDTMPELDEQKRKQYFCLRCLEPFSIGTPIITLHS